MSNIYKNIEEYSSNKICKVLIVFDVMIADMLSNKKKLNSVVAELFIRRRKLNIALVFIMQQYFKVRKDVFIVKIFNERELQPIACNHSSNIDFKNFMNLYKKCTARP